MTFELFGFLQSKTKWKIVRNNFKIGDVVIIKENNVPPAVWPLGIVITTDSGKDELVSVVTIKSLKGLFKKPISKFVLLPVHQERILDEWEYVWTLRCLIHALRIFF